MRIALATQGDQALLAIEVLSSMTRQGLLHPKECAQICIALGTSQNVKIAASSSSLHQALHDKFKTNIENEYLQAVDITYRYQRDVVGNVRGATCDPYRSILYRMMEVTRTGGIKDRTKFFKGLCARIEPDFSQRSSIDLEQYLQRSRFILENMAFFKYTSAEELDAAIVAMEEVFTRAGIVVVDSITRDAITRDAIRRDTTETELLGLTTPIGDSGKIGFDRLRTLAAFSTALSGLWHAKSYLRQQYGFSGSCGSTTTKSSENSSTVPKKVDGMDGRAFWERNSTMVTTLDSEQAMLNMCCAFIELHEGLGSKVAAISGSGLLEGMPSTKGVKGGRVRKAPLNQSSRKRRKT